MLKELNLLRSPDSYFSGEAGFVGSTLEKLHLDMSRMELPETVPIAVRRWHDAIRNAYIYSYFSYDILTLAVAQTFPCLELALREKVGHHFADRKHRNGRPNPPKLNELLDIAEREGLIKPTIDGLSLLRNSFAHGNDEVLNPQMFLTVFGYVTSTIRELFLIPG